LALIIDRLSDKVETNTGIFVDVNNTETKPLNVDTNGSGIDDLLSIAVGLDPFS
jgi:hypothetical protein